MSAPAIHARSRRAHGRPPGGRRRTDACGGARDPRWRLADAERLLAAVLAGAPEHPEALRVLAILHGRGATSPARSDRSCSVRWPRIRTMRCCSTTSATCRWPAARRDAAFASWRGACATGAGAADAVVQPRPQPAVAGPQRSRGPGARARMRAGAGPAAGDDPARRRAGAPGPLRRGAAALSRRAAPPSGLRRRMARAVEHQDAAAVGRRCANSSHRSCDARHRGGRPDRDGLRAGQARGRSRPLRRGIRRAGQPRTHCSTGARHGAQRHSRRYVDAALAATERLPLPRGSSARTARSIFIVGMPRSGSTLFEQILAAHPRGRRRAANCPTSAR